MRITPSYRLLSLAITLAVLVALLPGALPARAQEIDDPIPACSLAEILGFVEPMIDTMLTLSDLATRFETDDQFEILAEFDGFYLDWWTNVQPELPECALALRYERMMARALGQMYIVMVWSASESDAMLVGHPELLDEVSEEMTVFGELVTEMGERVE